MTALSKYTTTVGTFRVTCDPPHAITIGREGESSAVRITGTTELKVLERALGDLKFGRKLEATP